jgi:stage II sporulation protein D
VVRSEPVVRVRVAANQPSVRFEGADVVQVSVLTSAGAAPAPGAHNFATPLTITCQGNQFVLQGAGSAAMGWRADALVVTSDRGALSLNGTSYPGKMALHALPSATSATMTIDAVNHVLMETYLPGVIEHELYSSWHPQAFVTQAITARSYAISQLSRTGGRHFDLEATTSSQMYGGVARNGRAIEAVRQTRGVVLLWQGQVLPAYYSSSCGGSGQDASAAFPNAQTIPPLAARDHGTWCSNSPSFRWGPITQDRTVLAKRIAAWGKANQMSIGNLKSIAAIGATARNRVGRPTAFAIQDGSGTVYTLGPEHFRFACNFKALGVAAPARGTELKSSHVNVTLSGRNVVFSDGRGHGHGVGLCQYGAQALALQGYDAPSILNFYYPQTTLKRLY